MDVLDLCLPVYKNVGFSPLNVAGLLEIGKINNNNIIDKFVSKYIRH